MSTFVTDMPVGGFLGRRHVGMAVQLHHAVGAVLHAHHPLIALRLLGVVLDDDDLVVADLSKLMSEVGTNSMPSPRPIGINGRIVTTPSSGMPGIPRTMSPTAEAPNPSSAGTCSP